MITASDFRNGVTFEMEGNVFQIVEFLHVKPGKGAAFVRTKLKNVMTGAVIEKTFRPTEKFEQARIEKKNMEYSYNDGDLYYFMDPETFDMIPIGKDQVGMILSYKGNVFGIEPPTFVELAIAETEPGFAGNTATGATKPATLETGAVIQVPLFVDGSDIIRVDTRTGEYMERV